jgi:hypothetical protein
MRDRIDTSQLELSGIPASSAGADYVKSVHDLSADDVERLKKIRPNKLGIICGRPDCNKKLHAFRPPLRRAGLPAGCQLCGVEVVTWNLMQTRDLSTVDLKIEMLKNEWIRHFFFNIPIPPRVERFAKAKGLVGLEQVAHDQLTAAKMLNFNQKFDWNQTKMLDGTIVHWARHAVGCCCRRCMAYWHNVPLTATLTSSDIDYFRQFIMAYVKLRVPILGGIPRVLGPTAVSVDPFRKAM